MMPRITYRVIYNQDASHLFSRTIEPITPAHVDEMVDEVAQGGAELMLINPNCQRVNYPSNVWQTFWDGIEPGTGQADNLALIMQKKRLADQGCNYLTRALERCRQAGMASGVSVRMNDTHGTPWPDSDALSDFYTQHSEWRLPGNYMSDGPYAVIQALDYRQPEVREHYLALIRELVSDYSFEVLELDFMRSPHFFPQDTADQYCDVMTGFVREVRQLLPDGMSLLARVAVTPAAACDLGLDAAAWAREDLVDGIVVTAHFTTAWDMDLGAFRRLVGDDIALYPGVEFWGYCVDGLQGVMGLDETLLRGFAAAQYAGGADGIYLFNFFVAQETGREPLFAALGQLGDPDGLRGKAKTYCLMAGSIDGLYTGDGPYQVPRLAPLGRPQAFDILIGAEPAGQQVDVEVVVEGNDAGVLEEKARIHINEYSVGRAASIRPAVLAAAGKDLQTIEFHASTDMLRPGSNRIVFRNDGGPLTVVQLLVRVR
jgi:hypothetical protein